MAKRYQRGSSIYRFDYPFGIFWPFYFLSIFNLLFWLPLWYLLAILLSVHLQFTVLITPLVSFGHSIVCPIEDGQTIEWPKDTKGVINTVNWRWTDNRMAKRYQRGNQHGKLITPLVSFGHSIVCPSSIYRFDYPFGIFWPFYCLFIFNLLFWSPLWYLLAILSKRYQRGN
jgi:hypothetical protein